MNYNIVKKILNGPPLRKKSSLNTNPKVIGDYTIGEKLGEGTFSKVWLGTHIQTREKVAIKILDKLKIIDPSDKTRIEREINILKRLRHNNIIQLYCVIESIAKIYIVTEYCPGGELFEYIVSKKKLMENEACRIFQQVINGVEYLHKMKVVHRDLKPENLLFDYKREVKIADFGLSNYFPESGLIETACGSPCYAAPEMVKGLHYEGSAVDIWSLGIVLFTIVCGYLPFEDDNQEKLFSKISKGNFNLPHYISPLCRDLLNSILNVDPVRRFTFSQIREHPWFQNGQNTLFNISPGIDPQEKIFPVNF